MPADFWDAEQFRAAFAAQHIGQVSRAYRKHPAHIALYGKGGLSQETVGSWLGLTQAQISRIETGPPIRHLDNLWHWARTLRIPQSLLWFKVPPHSLLRITTSDLATTAATCTEPHLTALAAVPYADSDYVESVHQHIWHIIELDNRFGGTDLANLTIRCFRSLHQQLGTGAYQPAIERELQAVVGELAEVAGWLLYDADRQEDVRRMNQEALYFSRLAGDRQMELLTLQNSSMHAGFLGRPLEALHLAESVLQGRDRLPPRVKSLFLMRKARALAQGGDDQAVQLFAAVHSQFQDGISDTEPKWAWWVDERELAWHEGMAQLHLGRLTAAVDSFEHSVAATAPRQVRSRYLHLSYLLGAQTRIKAWRDAEATLHQLVPLANEVASQRTVVLLKKSLPRLCEPHVPPSTREAAEQLQLVLA